MIEALKYVCCAAGVVLVTVLVVFLACFGSWLFDRWNRDR